MGKSDPFVFSWYGQNLPKISPSRIAILGSTMSGYISQFYPTSKIDLYDIQLKNWNINTDFWEIDSSTYDLVICTRCAYFSKEPAQFIEKSLNLLKEGGFLFVDWGLGDHWRFKNYKVGWIKDDEHEYAYQEDNFLWSTVWTQNLLKHDEVKLFENRIKKYGYNDLESALKNEIPSIFHIDNDASLLEKCVKIDALSLWDENPQLYILTIFKK